MIFCVDAIIVFCLFFYINNITIQRSDGNRIAIAIAIKSNSNSNVPSHTFYPSTRVHTFFSGVVAVVILVVMKVNLKTSCSQNQAKTDQNC